MKYLINLDRFEIKLKQGTKTLFKFYEKISLFDQTSNFKINKRISIERSDSIVFYRYHQVYILKLDNRKFGLIKMYPYTNPGSSLISLSILNHILYTDFIPGLKYIFNEFDYSLNNISYLDISLDSQIDYTSTIIGHFLDPDLVLVSSKKIKHDLDLKSKLFKDGNLISSVYIGSKKSDKQVVSYNKSKDPKLKDKPYLNEIYEKEFGDDKDIYRTEVRLNNSSFVKYRNIEKGQTELKRLDIDIFKLSDKDYLVSIFSQFFSKLVDFRRRTNKNISRCEKIQLIDFEKINIYKIMDQTTIQLSKHNNYRQQKSFMRYCINNYLSDPNLRAYEDLEFFYNRFIRPVDTLKLWYEDYLSKRCIRITPPRNETKHLSLFGYKSNNYKISGSKIIDKQ